MLPMNQGLGTTVQEPVSARLYAKNFPLQGDPIPKWLLFPEKKNPQMQI